MNQKLYSIYDMRSKQFGIPFVAHNHELAKRTVASTLMTVPPTHLMYAFASDFELYYLGEVDARGTLVSCENGAEAIIFLSDIIQTYKIKKEREELTNDVPIQNELPRNDAE